MKKLLQSNKALTLTELLVASIMIGIVILGVVSFNFTVGSIERTTNRSTIIKTRAASAMLQMKRDVQLAVGDVRNPGIISFEPNANDRAICFRHDGGDPSTYGDDVWACYYHGGSNGLWLCPDKAAQPTDYTEASCASSAALPFHFKLTDGEFYEILSTTDSENLDHIDYVKIMLNTAYDPSTFVSCDTDPLKNPCYSLTTQISPVGHGR